MKIKKLPNGFGSIVYLGANRRKPRADRKSINGKYKYLGGNTLRSQASRMPPYLRDMA